VKLRSFWVSYVDDDGAIKALHTDSFVMEAEYPRRIERPTGLGVFLPNPADGNKLTNHHPPTDEERHKVLSLVTDFVNSFDKEK
jgi:hypothetical protein